MCSQREQDRPTAARSRLTGGASPGAGQEAGGRRQAQADGRAAVRTEESRAAGREEKEEERPAANRQRGACAVLS